MVYLLHFADPLERPWPIAHARHYIGYCAEGGVTERFKRHVAGGGARLVEVAVSRGLTVVIAREWPGAGRDFERQLKRRKKSAALCPICIEAGRTTEQCP